MPQPGAPIHLTPGRNVDDTGAFDEMIVRCLQGLATPEEDAALARWRHASFEHERYYQELATLWGLTGVLEPPVGAGAGAPIHELMRRIEGTDRGLPDRPRRGDPRVVIWRQWGLSAAAVTVLAVTAWWMWGPRVLSDRSTLREYANEGLGVDTLGLSDGTVVHLAPAARLTVASTSREVWLTGVAEFAVARDAQRPFRVRTASGDVEVLGTRFLVRAGRGSTELVVLEGRVAGSAGTDRVEVGPGQATVLVPGMRALVRKIDQVQSTTDWLRAAFVFQETSLEEVAQIIGRRFGMTVTVADPSLSRRTVSAWFTGSPSARQVLEGVCRAVGVRCTVGDSTAVIGSR